MWRHFGRVRHRRRTHQHAGVDLGADAGTRIRAVNEGLVAYSDNEVTGYGNLILVVHPDRSVTFYAHCRAVYVMAGQLVVRGQVLGEVGDTGYARGTHLHFEWHVEGRARDPLHHFVGFPAGVHITPLSADDEEVTPADELPAPRVRPHRADRRARSHRRPAHRAPNHRQRSRQGP
ncbi:MAG: M23 family metallopeptidase [Sandaracinaceae bacterium]|nr:M23 family metallopeptidase [Sandaracinaceae bacterium]